MKLQTKPKTLHALPTTNMYYKLSTTMTHTHTILYFIHIITHSCRKLYSNYLGIINIFSFEVEVKNVTYCEVRNAKRVSSTIVAICVAG